ncbi:MAG TPA: TonB-dependent receptor [Burkholderiaceae bacterium]|nr:TonB-dependent receptor [Burkholderiaceae bacterium]
MFFFRTRPWAAAALACVGGASLAQTSPPTQTITVTAARAEQALPDALPSTRIVTRSEIDAAQAADLPGLLRTLTSIDVAQTGPLGAQASLFLRGADSRQVLVLVDGVPFARADFGTASWQYLPLDQIERIEIVRGNHSALYGAQAVGGVVQIVTRRASAPQASVAVGTQGTRSVAASGGTAWGEGATATRVSGSLSWQRTDGYSARDPDVDPGANPDRDGARQSGAGLRVEQGWAQGHRTQLALGSSRTRSDYDGFTPGLDDELTTRVRTFAITTRHPLAPTLRLDAEAGQTREAFDDPNGFVPAAESRVRNLAATLGWQAAPAHALQFGVESRRDRYREPTAVRERTTDSVRVGWQGEFGHAWQLQANARRDASSAFGAATTGLAALGWRFAPGWRASVQASSGFSVPSFLDELFAGPAGLKAERSRQAEAALQWHAGAARVRAALFVQRQRDRIAFDPVTFEAVNIARAKNRGLEAMAQLPLASGQLTGELTLQDPRNADTDTPLKRRARQSLALGWTGDIGGWALRASLRHTGKRLDTDPVTFGDATTPSRTTLGFGVARTVAPGWRVALAVDNAADSTRPEVTGYTAAPRTVLLTLQATVN